MTNVISPSPLLTQIFPREVTTAEYCNFRGRVRPLPTDEAHVRYATPKRREEFAAGRLCAYEALKCLGRADEPIGRQPSGAPIWPTGTIGSISHTDGLAAAVAASSKDIIAVGVDVERIGAVDPALWPMLFSKTERRCLEARDKDTGMCVATIIFGAKEAFYKAQWPLTHEWVDFLDIEIDISHHSFTVSPLSEKAWSKLMGQRPIGQFAIAEDIVAASVAISHQELNCDGHRP